MDPLQHPVETVFAERYLIRRLVDVDTVAQTYVATDQVRQEEIILKILHDDIAEEGGGFTELSKVLRRCSRLNHPSITRIFDFGTWQNQIYLTTEMFPGPTLRQELDRLREHGEQFSSERIKGLVNDIAQALIYAHPIIAHGNLRPESIHLAEDGRVRLSDFGLSCLASIAKLRSNASLTRQAQYLAPELFQSTVPSRPATDWYSLGVIWLELLGGNPLSGILSPDELSQQLPAKVRQAITHLTASNPERRLHQSRAILPQLAPKRFQRKPLRQLISPFILGVTALIAGIGSVFLWSSWNSQSVNQHGLPLGEKAQWTTQIYELDRTRHQLLIAALPHTDVRSALTNYFGAHTEIELIDDIATAYESGSIQTPRIRSDIDAQIRQRQETLLAASNFVHQLAISRELLKTVVESNELVKSPLPLQEWQSDLQESIESFNQGQFTQAATQCRSTHSQIRTSILQLWHSLYSRAEQAQTEWRQRLASQSIPWIEPARSLSSELQQFREPQIASDLPQELHQLQDIGDQYNAWVKALEGIPKPQTQHRTNSIGMRFVPVDEFLCSIWETRIIDFAHFVNETGTDVKRLWLQDAQQVDPTHPVTHVSRYNALEFCQWLTARERAAERLPAHLIYRLPTDREWSRLAGLLNPEIGDNPRERHWRADEHFPWGERKDKTAQTGNYFTAPNASPSNNFQHTMDRYHRTAPVGQFAANPMGLFDVGGNAAEWVHERWNPGVADADWGGFVARGGSWRTLSLHQMRTAHRIDTTGPLEDIGFRCVIAPPLDPEIR